MKQKPLLTALAALLLLLASCKNDIKSNLSIPKDAAFVFHVNSSSLASKLSWEDIKSSAWFKELYQNANDAYAQHLLDHPDSSGVDISKDLAFFMQRRGSGGYAVFEGSIKNAAAFEALVKKFSGIEQTEKSGEWNMISANDRAVVSWNESRFAVISDMPMGSMNPMMNSMGEVSHFSADSLKIFVKEIMAVKGSNSLFDDKRFAAMVKEDGDMHMWTNSGSLYSDLSGMMSMMKMGSLFSEAVSASTINFEDGKITMSSKSFMGKEMMEMMEKWDSKKVEAAVLNRIPSDNVIGVIAANVDPKSLQSFFKAMGLDGMINMMLAKQNINANEVFSATKGQFVLSFSDLSIQNKTVTVPGADGAADYTTTRQSPDFSMMFATSVDKKPSFQNLLNALFANEPALPFSYKLNDDWFVAANKTETVDGFLSGKAGSKPFTEKISGHPFGMYFDMQRLLKTNFTEDVTTSGMLADAAATWQNMIVTGGEVKNGAVTTAMEVNMVDKKTNSLKQLNRFIERMYNSSKRNKVAYNSRIHDTDGGTTDVVVEAKPE